MGVRKSLPWLLGLLALIAGLALAPETAEDQVGDLVELRIGPVLYDRQVERIWRREGDTFRAQGAPDLTLAEVKKLHWLNRMHVVEGEQPVLQEPPG
ncbi:hypothetical protein DYH09_32170 [bacterium CPR1]|nr:hypothetical protein [bacterium CPR1]